MRYKAIRNIHHNNIKVTAGGAIELSDAEAKPLLEVKAIEPWAKPFSKEFVKSNLNQNSSNS